jgi:hypothetical protein
MTRFRQWILSLAVALALLVPVAGTASADPGDPGTMSFSGSGAWTTTTRSDPGDPGTTY